MKMKRMNTAISILFWAISLLALGGFAESRAADMPFAPANSVGRVNGKVVVSGLVPPALPLPVFKSRQFCGPTVANETLLVSKDGGLQNAVVTLRPRSALPEIQAMKLTLDNRHCAFVPHVQVALVGSELLLKNSDPILHTVHARFGSETLFNVGLPHWRQVTQRLDRPGVMRINCDVLHTWMSAVIVVAQTPYFAVTDRNGWFEIAGIPAGPYDTEIWHERLGRKFVQINVNDSSTALVEVVYSAPSL
jgi:hypothetical protein